jgi:hypothetical protein
MILSHWFASMMQLAGSVKNVMKARVTNET